MKQLEVHLHRYPRNEGPPDQIIMKVSSQNQWKKYMSQNVNKHLEGEKGK